MKRERPEVDKRKKPAADADPVNGVKFDTVDPKDELQLAALAHRGRKWVELVARNSADLRAKRACSDGVWDEGRRLVSVKKAKGKHFQVMGFAEKEVTWLQPEEALWLVDSGQLALRGAAGDKLPRSWLWERLFCTTDIAGLAPQHYAAYQHLRSSGYPTRRWSRRAPTPAMSLAEPGAWERMVHEQFSEGWIVFEVWPPHQAASFRRSDPPKSSWRILPWSIDADCGAAAAWNRVAGPGAMMALSGVTGTRCSFLEVAKCTIGPNPAVPQAKDIVLKHVQGDRKRAKEGPQAMADQEGVSRGWFPTAQQWLPE
jgi:hypothetical protein